MPTQINWLLLLECLANLSYRYPRQISQDLTRSVELGSTCIEAFEKDDLISELVERRSAMARALSIAHHLG
jgi:hypothetical protein